MPLRRCVVRAAKKTEIICDRGAPDSCHPQSRQYRLGKRQLGKVAATGVDHQGNHRTLDRVYQLIFDQPDVQDTVEQLVVYRVVQMTICIIVVPSGLHLPE